MEGILFDGFGENALLLEHGVEVENFAERGVGQEGVGPHDDHAVPVLVGIYGNHQVFFAEDVDFAGPPPH